MKKTMYQVITTSQDFGMEPKTYKLTYETLEKAIIASRLTQKQQAEVYHMLSVTIVEVTVIC